MDWTRRHRPPPKNLITIQELDHEHDQERQSASKATKSYELLETKEFPIGAPQASLTPKKDSSTLTVLEIETKKSRRVGSLMLLLLLMLSGTDFP